MTMKRDYYVIDGYHATVGDAIKTFQQIAKNIGEDKPCYYSVATFQDAIRWAEDIILTEEIASDIINNVWFYPEVREVLKKAIENELHIQLGERNLTLEDFRIKLT